MVRIFQPKMLILHVNAACGFKWLGVGKEWEMIDEVEAGKSGNRLKII